jgi:hypothetical protein
MFGELKLSKKKIKIPSWRGKGWFIHASEAITEVPIPEKFTKIRF